MQYGMPTLLENASIAENAALCQQLQLDFVELNMHLHDALGKSNHLALGAGELPIARYHQLAKEQNCRVVLETKTIEGLTPSVQYLRQHILCGEK